MTTPAAKAETPLTPAPLPQAPSGDRSRRPHPTAAIRAAESSSERCRLLLANLDAVADLLAEGAIISENERSLSDQSTAALRSAGIFGMLVPDDLGGNEVAPLAVYEVLQRLSAIDASTAWTAAILLQGAGEMATVLEPRAAQAMFADRIPLRVLSLAPGSATETADGYIVDGQWNFLSGLRQADFVAVTFEVDARTRRCALIPKQPLEALDDWRVLGMRGTGSSSVRATGVLVPRSMTYDRFDPSSYARPDTPMGRLGPTRYVLLGNGAYPLGVARRALDELLQAAPLVRRGARINTGQMPSLAEASWFQRELGELNARWLAADSLARRTLAQLAERQDSAAGFTLADTDALQIVSSFACKTGVDIVTRVFRVLGSSAIRDETLIARQLRDLNTLAAHGGLGEAGFEDHGAFILGLQDEARRRAV
jgi:indole-3-acetate monooxygenase